MSAIIEAKSVRISDIEPNPFQPRTTFDEDKLQELAESIKQTGLVQPIILRQNGPREEKKYQIVAGERRWRASKKAGLTEIFAVIKDISSENVLLESYVENVQRRDLTPIENENAIFTLYKSGKFTKTNGTPSEVALANALSVTQHWISDVVEAHEFRERTKKYTREYNLSTWQIARTRGLEDETRLKILTTAKNDHELQEMVRIAKQAPKDLAQSFLKGDITVDDANEAIDTLNEIKEEGKEVDEKKQKKYTEELRRRRKKENAQKKLQKKADKRILTDDQKLSESIVNDTGQLLLDELDAIADQFLSWGLSNAMILGEKRWNDARKRFQKIRDHADKLLGKTIEARTA